MERLRKGLIVSVMSVTVLSMSMLMVPFTVGAASAGDLIKMDGLSSVYYLAADGKRYVFPNETTYFSWYGDFSSVVTILQSELESYPLGANVTMRPGTKLVKITTDPKVYAVEPNGTLKWVPDETTASTLWGENWAGLVVDVPDAFFTNYTIDPGQVSADAYPTGSLVKWAEAADVYYVDADGKARKVADEAAFLANRFKWGNIITAPDSVAMPEAGTDIAAAEGDLTDTSSGAGGTAGAGTGLTVSIASDTPEAGNIPAGSPNDFLKLNFIASADGAVSVNSVKLSAYDLGTATNIRSVTFYDDGVKLGNAKNMNSDREATFNFSSPIEIAAGATKSLMVKATILAGVTGGNYALGVDSASDVITNGAVVSGSFPIIGNTKAIVSGVAIGTVTISSPDGTDTDDVQFGEDDVLLASFNLAVANEPVIWESASFRNGGTNNADILSNVRLLIDGDEVATAAGLVDKYVNFSVGNYLIAKNDTVSVEIYGDMGIANVGNTIELYIKDATDLAFVGQDFGFGLLLTDHDLLDTAAKGKKITLAAGDFTIDMDKAATPAKDVRGGDTDVVLATIKMTSNGENATTDGIKDDSGDEFIIAGTGLQLNEIDNVELRNVDTNVIYDISFDNGVATNTFALTLDEEISFVKGVTKTFELRCDLQGPNDADPIEENDTLRVTLEDGAFTLTGDTSDAPITNITPSSVTGAIATVKSASLTWTTTSLTDKKVVPGAEDVIIYKAGLEVGESSSVKLQSVRIDVIGDDGDVSGSFLDTNISKLDLYIVDSSGDKLLKTRSNAITEGVATVDDDNYINFTSLNSTNRVIAAGTDVNLELRADFTSSFATTSTWDLGIDNVASRIVAKDKDNNEVAENVVIYTGSRNVTLAEAGTLKVELKVDDIKANSNTYLLAGTETTADRYLGELVFTTANEDVKVKTLVLGQASSTTGADISAIKLYDKDGAEVASKSPTAAGHANFDTFNYTFPADEATSLFIGVVAKSINADGDPEGTATFYHDVMFTMANVTQLGTLSLNANEAVTAIGIDSGEDVDCDDAGDASAAVGEYTGGGYASTTVATITGSVLNSVVNDMSDGTLTGGANKTIAKYKFVFDNGSNRTATNEELMAELHTLVLTISTSSSITATGVQAYIEGSSAYKTTIVPGVAGTATIDLTSLTGTTELVDGTVTLVIIADITDTSGTGEYLQTSIADLDGNGDFTYNGNNGTGNDFTDVRLDIADVIGATLSN
jgi:hypothetical protein